MHSSAVPAWMPKAQASPAAPRATGDTDRPLSSAILLDGRSTLVIDHLGERYILRATRKGKLILTK